MSKRNYRNRLNQNQIIALAAWLKGNADILATDRITITDAASMATADLGFGVARSTIERLSHGENAPCPVKWASPHMEARGRARENKELADKLAEAERDIDALNKRIEALEKNLAHLTEAIGGAA